MSIKIFDMRPSPALVRELGKWGILFGLSVILTATLYYTLPRDLYPDFEINSLRRCVKYAISIGWTTLLLAVVSHLPRLVAALTTIVFFFPSVAELYLARVHKIFFGYELISNIIESTTVEMLSFMSPLVIGSLILYILVMGTLGWLLTRVRPAAPHRWACVTLATILLIGATRVEALFYGIFPVLPINDIHYLTKYYRERDGLVLSSFIRLDGINVAGSDDAGEVKDQPIVVLHMGESVRADHAPFNGYTRNTMPRVMAEFEAGRLVSFPTCVSFSIWTRFSVVGLLTTARVLDPAVRQGTFIPYLNANGITTMGFLSSLPVKLDGQDFTLARITEALQKRIVTDNYVEAIQPQVVDYLSQLEGGAFMFYYGEGSHIPFISYNQEKYGVFKPYATDWSEEDELCINAYDNTIVATDAFIGSAIDALKDKKALYIYFADHGEMLGEDGQHSRDDKFYRRPETRHVLAFIWASDRFREECPDLWNQLKANRERLGIISHDVVYHTVLSAFNIENEFYDKTCDLFSPDAEPFPTAMPEATSFGHLQLEERSPTWPKTKKLRPSH